MKSGIEKIRLAEAELNRIIRGKPEVIHNLLIAFVSGGNILLDDVPGVGKATLAKALARLGDAQFSRIQFTPDLLPADIIGTNIYNPREGSFQFRPGPVFTNILLADEINRASPRTQSALLECMCEHQVSFGGISRELQAPFMVIATQNPIEFQGTYPLPEAQLDRFAMRLSLGYPSEEAEAEMLADRRSGDPADQLSPVIGGEEILELRRRAADVGMEQDKALTLLEGIYSTVIVRDILEREKRRGQRQLTDAMLLKKIVLFLADNIGSSVSISSIGNTLVSEGLLDDSGRRGKPSAHTVQAYVNALLESYFFYEIKRFDIKGKEYLRTLGKYYIVDIGLRNYLLGYRDGDSGHILENIIYFELLRRGYDVAIGKIDNQEVDFIATKADEKKYVQVTESMNAPETRERELAPLRKIRDSYEKIVIALESNLTQTQDGIKIIRALDFLLE